VQEGRRVLVAHGGGGAAVQAHGRWGKLMAAVVLFWCPSRSTGAGGRGGGGYGAASPEGEAAKQRWRPGAMSSEESRRSQARRAPFTHAEVEAGATRRGFDAQRMTGGGGRPALMVSQQEERPAELQDPEVRAELNWRVRGCERECSTGGRLGSIPQACARARQ
jgi:hypothetical protein